MISARTALTASAAIMHVWNDECVNLSLFGKDNRDPFAGVQTHGQSRKYVP